MKHTFILGLLIISACGKYDGVGSDTVGEVRSMTSSQLNSADLTNIGTICNALSLKASILPQVVNSSHTFLSTQTDCERNSVLDGNVEVLIQTGGAGYVFKRKSDGLDYIFPELETAAIGIMADICGSQGSLVNPMVGSNGVTYVTTSSIPSADCAPVSGELCVKIEKASVQNGSYVVHTKEWMRVRTNLQANKVGFFTFRKRVAKSYCGQDETIVTTATLK